jgi:hypothetical protein
MSIRLSPLETKLPRLNEHSTSQLTASLTERTPMPSSTAPAPTKIDKETPITPEMRALADRLSSGFLIGVGTGTGFIVKSEKNSDGTYTNTAITNFHVAHSYRKKDNDIPVVLPDRSAVMGKITKISDKAPDPEFPLLYTMNETFENKQNPDLAVVKFISKNKLDTLAIPDKSAPLGTPVFQYGFIEGMDDLEGKTGPELSKMKNIPLAMRRFEGTLKIDLDPTGTNVGKRLTNHYELGVMQNSASPSPNTAHGMSGGPAFYVHDGKAYLAGVTGLLGRESVTGRADYWTIGGGFLKSEYEKGVSNWIVDVQTVTNFLNNR